MPKESNLDKELAPAAQAPERKKIYYDYETTELTNRNQYPSDVWLHDPAMLELLSMADQRLSQVNLLNDGLEVRPEEVRAVLVMPDRKVYIRPLTKEEKSEQKRGLEVKHNASGSTWINLRRLLQPHNLLVEPGYRLRYSVRIAPPTESPIGNALEIDLTKSLEKVRENRNKNKSTPIGETETEPEENS